MSVRKFGRSFPFSKNTGDEFVENREAATRGVSYKKDFLKNFAKFTGKHLCQSLCFNKLAG